ncbi:MAG: tyrosine-type recombinase/integrase [Actinomycetota bacterium]
MDEGTLKQLAVFMRSRNYSEKTIKLYVASNRHWDVEPGDIDRQAVTSWIWGADTQSKRRHRWLASKQLMACLQEVGLVDDASRLTDGLKMPQEPLKVLPALSDSALDFMVKACSGKRFIDRRDKAMILTLAATGLRANEFMSLLVEDVDPEAGLVFVRHRGISRGKTGRERVAYLDTASQQALFTYLRQRANLSPQSSALWLTRSGKAAQPDVLRGVLSCRVRGSNARVTPHMFRRRLAIKWLTEGGSQVGLQQVAGWHGGQMPAHYSAIAAGQIAQADYQRIFRTQA